MSDVPNILHEEDVREVIQDEIEKTVGIANLSIADVTAVNGDQAGLVSAINDILAVLRTNGLIATPASPGY